jgi:hypothetical protein
MRNATGSAREVLTRFYAAETEYLSPEGGDFGVMAELLDPGVAIYQADALPYSGVWRGHDGFKRWMEAFGEVWLSLEVRDPQIFESGETVFSRSTCFGVSRRTGRSVDWPLLQQIKIENGLIKEIWPFYWDTAYLLEFITPK